MRAGFISKEISFKDLIVKQDFTNAIIFGRTGSGKTSCAILPNIEERIKSNHGVLIYDFKGNLHLQVKHIANRYGKLNKVTQIGTPWGSCINLFDYLNFENIALIISGDDKDSYWLKASRTLFLTVAKIYKEIILLKKDLDFYVNFVDKLIFEKEEDNFIKPLSFYQIHKYLYSQDRLKEFYNLADAAIRKLGRLIDDILRKDIEKDTEKSKFRLYEYTFYDRLAKLKDLLKSIEYYNYTENKQDSGRMAVLNHLSSLLNDISSKEYLNNSQVNIVELLRKGEIVIIDVSSFSENTLNILNLAIYTRLQKNRYKNPSPVTIFVDEAQKVLSPEYLPQTDVCRESRFEYIFATQDEILLRNKLGFEKYDELYVNLISKYSFATNDNDLDTFEYLDISTNKKSYATPMHFKEKDLIKVEYKFQKDNSIFMFSDYEAKNNEIYNLVFDDVLIDDYKILVKTIDGEYIESNFISNPNILYLGELEAINNEIGFIDIEEAAKNGICLGSLIINSMDDIDKLEA